MQKRAIYRIGANSAWLAGERVIRILAGLFVLGYVARYLGREQFGVLNYAISITAVLACFANAGIDGVVIRELVKAPEAAPKILGTAWLLKFAGGLACVAGIGAAALVGGADSRTLWLVLMVSLYFLPQSFEVIDLWFQKHIQSKYTVLAKIAAILASAGTKIALVQANAPIAWFCAAQALDAVFLAAGLLLIYRARGGSVLQWRPSRGLAALLLRDGWPLMLSGILVALYIRIEQFFVMNWLGADIGGVYYASVRVTEIWHMIPALLLPSLYPLLLQKREENPELYKRRVQDVFDIMTACGLLVALGVTLAAPLAIHLIYGAEFKAAAPILMIQAWAAPFTFSGAVRAQYFIMERLTLYHTWSALLGIAVNVALALWLMPSRGAPGAALAALAGYAVSAYFSSLLFRELRPCAVFQTRAFTVPFRIPSLLAHLQKA